MSDPDPPNRLRVIKPAAVSASNSSPLGPKTGSSKMTVMLLYTSLVVAPSAGLKVFTVGPTVSMVKLAFIAAPWLPSLS